MKNVNKILIISLSFIFLLSGCAANNEMAKVVEHLSQSNRQAQVIIEQLAEKDKAVIALLNARTSHIQSLIKSKLSSLYYKHLNELNQDITLVEKALDQAFSAAILKCNLLVDEELDKENLLVKQAQNQALALHHESQNFPTDKTLELQAAKASADYFGRLVKLNNLAVDAKHDCAEKLTVEKTSATSSIETFQRSQLASLSKIKANKESAIDAMNFTIYQASSNHFDTLVSWTRENQIAYSNSQMYMKLKNPLSSEGVLATVVKGFGAGAIAIVTGKDVVVPSKSELKNSGKLLIDGVTKGLKEEFISAKSNAEQALSTLKERGITKVNEIVQGAVLSILRK